MINKASRVVVVTGANKGIGYSIVEGLTKFSDKPSTVLTARSDERGKAALQKLLDASPSSKEQIFYHQLDVTKKESIKNFVDWAKASFDKIDVLVNNAGVMPKNELTSNYLPSEEDLRSTLGTNFEGVRSLTYQILPILSEDGKIINISASLGLWKNQGETAVKILTNPGFEEKDLDELSAAYFEALKKGTLKESGYRPSSYMLSKALLNAWTYYVLPKKLKGEQQTLAVCPGWCRTDLGGEKAVRSAEQGAETILYLIGLPYKRDPNLHGRFLRDKKVISY